MNEYRGYIRCGYFNGSHYIIVYIVIDNCCTEGRTDGRTD